MTNGIAYVLPGFKLLVLIPPLTQVKWHWSISPIKISKVKWTLIIYAAQYDAWCRNNGTHSTQKRGHVRWNAQLMWKSKSEQDYEWEVLQDEIPNIFDDLKQSIEHSLSYFKSFVDSKANFPILSVRSCWANCWI